MAVTIAGLLLLLPVFGAMGTAIVSVVTYATTLVWLLVCAPGSSGRNWWEHIVSSQDDMAALIDRLSCVARVR